jgi:hypothetical protein
MLARLLAVQTVVDFSKFALVLSLATIAGGLIAVGAFYFLRPHAMASVLNVWICRDPRPCAVAGLWVRAVGAVLCLDDPQGNSAHSANRQGIHEIMTIVAGIATAHASQGGSDGQR